MIRYLLKLLDSRDILECLAPIRYVCWKKFHLNSLRFDGSTNPEVILLRQSARHANGKEAEKQRVSDKRIPICILAAPIALFHDALFSPVVPFRKRVLWRPWRAAGRAAESSHSFLFKQRANWRFRRRARL